MSGIVRGLAGTQDVDHDTAAPVQCGMSALTITDLAAVSYSAWADWTATLTGFLGGVGQDNVYIQIGKIVILHVNISGTSNANTLTFTLPVLPKTERKFGGFIVFDNGIFTAGLGRVDTPVTGIAQAYGTGSAGVWTTSNAKGIEGVITYEAA